MFDDNDVVKLIVNGKYVVVTIRKRNNRLYLYFRYNKEMIAEIKCMESPRWHGFEDPPEKVWSIADSQRNHFQLTYLMGKNPYQLYQRDLIRQTTRRSLYLHQQDIVDFIVGRRCCIVAAEMGTGKSLAAIEAMEIVQPQSIWWVSPKAALNSTRLELFKWNAKIRPELHTYESLVKRLSTWESGMVPPQAVIFDECSRLKTPTAQRTQAARHLANNIREHWRNKAYVVLMSGSPAPKNPGDWWSLTEIACPGYLKEGSLSAFIQRLCVTQKNESVGGGSYNKIVAWKDSENRCSVCGLDKEHPDHSTDEFIAISNPLAHAFSPSKNEVAYLYERMKGLVTVKFKKDCLDLPEKQYEIIKLKPTINIINSAKLITNSTGGAAEKLVLLRELSDGFQYKDEYTDKKLTCEACFGSGKIGDDPCLSCSGKGYLREMIRVATQLPTPKIEALIDQLENHEEIGRLVIYAAFTASIDRIVDTCLKQKWDVIRVDGRGWKHYTVDGVATTDSLQMLRMFQSTETERVVFVGHPGSAGMGLTLTASPTIVYYSNDFNAESRIQSEDRIHRVGMDINRGAKIIDFVHLPTDKLVIDNLKKKRDLQGLTLGELKECLDGESLSTT